VKRVLVAALAACGPGAADSTVVVPAEHVIYEFAGDAAGIAWCDKGAVSNQIRYRELGGAPILIAPVKFAMEPIAIDHDFVYWTKSDFKTAEVWRWSRTQHTPERLAEVAGAANALLVRPDAIWVGTSAGAFKLPHGPGKPEQMFVLHAGDWFQRFVMLDGQIAVVTTTNLERAAVYVIGNDAAVITIPWPLFAIVSDGHTVYASDSNPQLDQPSTIWSATAGHPLAALPDWSKKRGALILVGADEHGLYLADDRGTWLRSPTGEIKKLGRRVMHGELDHGLVYGTTTDDDLDMLIVQER
jgi:hypothetical protein